MCVYIPTQVLATMYGLANTCTCYTSQVPRLCFSLKMAMLVRIRSSYVTCLSPPFPLDSVCIIPEEVGSSCSIIGTIVVALRRGSLYPRHFLGQKMDWKTGHLMFIESGRRCQGGPGRNTSQVRNIQCNMLKFNIKFGSADDPISSSAHYLPSSNLLFCGY